MRPDHNTGTLYKAMLGKMTESGEFEVVPTTTKAKYFRATGAAAIASTLAPGVAWQLESIRIHLSAAGASGNLTATIDHSAGTVYDIVLLTQDMTSVVNLVWTPERPMEFQSGDELDIAWANAGTKTYGLEIIWKQI